MDITNLYIISFSIIYITAIYRPYLSRVKLLKRKPFNCELCVTFWLTLWYNYQTNRPLMEAFVVALLAVLALAAYEKLIRYLLK